MVVYRVSFEGDELTNAAIAALTAAGTWWEGTSPGPEEPSRHRALVPARDEQQAVEAVDSVLASHGAFGEYIAAAARNACGEVWRGPFYRKWSEIDWQATPERARLTDLQRAVLGALVEWGLPTWMVLRDMDVPADPATVEAVLEDLQGRGFVYSTLEGSGEPGRESELVRWWAITHEAWDLLGFIKSPRYR
jgi:hypothetical protein